MSLENASLMSRNACVFMVILCTSTLRSAQAVSALSHFPAGLFVDGE